MTIENWTAKTQSLSPNLDLEGDSPGGIAARLRVSRQAVHKAIRRGDLDAVVIVNHGKERVIEHLDGPMPEGTRAIIVSENSMRRFMALRRLRKAG